jgi:hypothetical protein
MLTVRALEIGHIFILKTDGTNGCVYKKIKPIEIQGVICNAARCWKNQSELVRYPDNAPIMEIVGIAL